MKKTLVQFFLFFIVSALVVYAYFLTKANFGTLVDFKSQIEQDAAKVTIKDFSLDETDADKPIWKLNSKEAKLFENAKEMQFSKVLFKIFQEDHKDYLIESDNGIYKMDEKLIILKDSVKVSSKDGFVFSTNKIYYYTDTKIVDTDDQILAKYPNNKIEVKGKGLEAKLDEKYFTILEEGTALSEKEKIDIKSNRVNFHTKDNMVEFLDNVRAKKNNINIFCNKMFVYYDKIGFQSMKAYGSVKILIEGGKKAYGKEAVLDNKKLSLSGNAKFIVKRDEFVGSLIEYNLKTGDVEVKNVKGKVREMKKK